MKRLKLVVSVFISLMLVYGCTTEKKNNGTQGLPKGEDLTQYVNPNIGTDHSRWFFYTPAAVPFGLAKLGASTNGSYGNADGWQAVGYEDGHTSIEGFPCFHEFQVGGVMLMPTVGDYDTYPGMLETPEKGYRSLFKKENEFATSGYYSVLLDKYNVKAELTATDRVGFQRYTFPESSQASIIFDIGSKLGESGAVIDSYIEKIDASTIVGSVTTKPEYVKAYQPDATVKMFFYAKLSKPSSSSVVFDRGEKKVEGDKISGKGACMGLTFATKDGETITVKLGQSFTSIENAKLNLNTEAKEMTFDDAKLLASERWNEMLGRIVVEGKNRDDKVKFYTGLYHALLGRGLANDVNGAYPKNDGSVGMIPMHGDKPTHNFYNTDAIWGGFWNLTQLWALAYPEYYADWIQGQLLVYKETGWLGDGIANSKYVSGVGTNFTSLAIASAYNCGIKNFDANLGFEASYKNEVDGLNRPSGAGKLDVPSFVERGFCPYIPNMQLSKDNTSEGSVFGTSHTLEYAFSSFAVAQFAKQLGKDKEYKQLMGLASNWRNVFDSETGLMRPKTRDGKFIKDFNPIAPWIGFQEGNAIQYSFYVPHEPKELVKLIGEDEFNNRLDSIFIRSQQDTFGGGKEVNAFAGIEALYNHGNQPNLHISWLFNFSERPDLTQKWVRTICNEFYGVDGLHGYGYGQDEDQGQLGAWYVMSAMGLFDVKGLTEFDPSFQIGSPLFDRVEVKLNKDYYYGDKFVIETRNNSNSNMYVQGASINGKKTDKLSISFDDVVDGGTIVLDMGSEPVTKLPM